MPRPALLKRPSQQPLAKPQSKPSDLRAPLWRGSSSPQLQIDVRLGQKQILCAAKKHVRFTPKSGHVQCTSRCPLLMHHHSITASARATSVPSAPRETASFVPCAHQGASTLTACEGSNAKHARAATVAQITRVIVTRRPGLRPVVFEDRNAGITLQSMAARKKRSSRQKVSLSISLRFLPAFEPLPPRQ